MEGYEGFESLEQVAGFLPTVDISAHQGWKDVGIAIVLHVAQSKAAYELVAIVKGGTEHFGALVGIVEGKELQGFHSHHELLAAEILLVEQAGQVGIAGEMELAQCHSLNVGNGTDAVEWVCENGDRADRHSVGLYVQMNNLLDEACIEHHDVIERQVFAASINAIRLNGINADALQQFLATRGIYVGVGGSACSAAHDYRVLRAYGLTDGEASEVIRVSFGDETTARDIEALVEGIKEYKEMFIV